MTLTPKNYRRRVVDEKIGKYLRAFGAVSIEGPKWCGKTWSVLNHSNSIAYLMDPDTMRYAELNPDSALKGDRPHGIDEWQQAPEIWDAVRFSIDRENKKGLYLLTGSVSLPDRPKKRVRHSGIGRIVRIKMRPMSLFESGYSGGEVSLGDLMAGIEFRPAKAEPTIEDVVDFACKGGWPAGLNMRGEDAFEIPVQYIRGIPADDTGNFINRIRNVPNFRFLLSSLARNNASLVKNVTLHNDVQNTGEGFSVDSLNAYLQILRNMYLIEEIPGWNPHIRSKARMFSGPKRMFVDPSLAVAALGATPGKLLSELSAFGGIFEGMCLRDLLVYADANDAEVFHYRDNSDLEIDAILETRDGNWAALEIKLGEKQAEEGVAALMRLRKKLVSGNAPEPVCLAVITAAGIAHKRADGVYIIPITVLRD
ncbi:MAG: DUF4143 domain-containing protein [Clostridiales Family XIII bacterium]|jgi:predicted AAA+ superfamily ATPase|nr:DUF4143 domain-containing protein [Clostridiales Family XIII bacterium]